MNASKATLRCAAALLIVAAFFVGTDAGTVHLNNFPWSGHFDPHDQPDSEYFIFSSVVPTPFFADDGTFIQRRNSTATLDITPFQKTVPQGPGGSFDHLKNLVFHKTFWATPSQGVLKCELDMKTELFHVDLHPFGDCVTDPDNDARLASCGLVMFDQNTWTEALLVQTNKENQPFYGRQPFGKGTPALGNYRAFRSIKTGVSDRPDVWSYQHLAIEYHRNQSSFQWFVDGMQVHSVSPIGVPAMSMTTLIDHGGMDTVVDPNGFLCGFGCFNLLDGSNPANATDTKGLVKLVSGIPGYYVHPTSFNDTASDLYSRLWGQGAIASYRKFKVGIHDH